jgi:type IV pilus assembly protein PilM
LKVNGLGKLTAIFRDPPPELAFEISEAGISMGRTKNKADIRFEALPAGAVVASPVTDNVLSAEALTDALAVLLPPNGSRKRTAALILPDYSTRISVMEFDSFPEKAEDQQALVRFRLRKSVPFDVESAALGYWRQASAGGKKHEVVVAVTPLETVARYEAPFRARGIQTGFVTVSSLAALELAAADGVSVIAKINGHVLTVMVAHHTHLKLLRSIELTDYSLDEIAADLFPTFVYIEDHFQVRAARLLLCGFGNLERGAVAQFHPELNIPVEPLHSPLAPLTAYNAGLLGYMQGAEAA